MANVTAVTYVNQKDDTHSTVLCDLVLEIWKWCLQSQITLQAEHLLGQLNVVADLESRSLKDWWDWLFNPAVFQQIHHSLGLLHIDLFASSLTKQLPRYYNWRLDPEATATDAFTQNWAQERGFANPPWCLIPQYLTQIRQQQARVV